LVNLGALRPLVSMMAVDAEPKHYAGLALLKLADNFENHLKIAEVRGKARLSAIDSLDYLFEHQSALDIRVGCLSGERHARILCRYLRYPPQNMDSCVPFPRWQEGGIQALLRLGRSRSTDEELQVRAHRRLLVPGLATQNQVVWFKTIADLALAVTWAV
jgi:hypothetical protein